MFSIKKGRSILFALILFGFYGCGGGDSSLPSEVNGGGAPSVGEVMLTVKWDESALKPDQNKILNAAQGLKVTATGPRIAAPIVDGVNRTAGAAQATLTLKDVPIGDDSFLIEAFNTPWEQATSTGLIQSGSTPLTVKEGTNDLTVNLGSDLCFAVTVSPLSKTIGVGDSQPFSAVARNADNEILLSKAPTWTSGNGAVASVDSNGLAIGLSRGLADIQAACDNRSGQAALSVIVASPKNLRAVAGDGSVTLTWDLVSGASGYRIYHRTVPLVNKGNGIAVPVANSPATIHNLVNGTRSYFVVTALAGNEESLESAEVSAAPVLSTGSVQITIQ